MYDNYNYPPGADTPEAPWNQMPDDEFTRTVSVSMSFDYTITLPEDADEEWIKESIEEEVREIVKKLSRETRIDNFGIDEVEVIDE